jgi:hypothetical protein
MAALLSPAGSIKNLVARCVWLHVAELVGPARSHAKHMGSVPVRNVLLLPA